MESMFTMASVAVKNLPLEEQLPPDAIEHFHEARNIPCLKVLIQKKDNVPQPTISLVTETVGLANHFIYQNGPSEVQSKLHIGAGWAQL